MKNQPFKKSFSCARKINGADGNVSEKYENPPENSGLVSVIMPNYNSGAFIAKSIESVLNQTYPYWELIIADDCSADGSLDTAVSFGDKRIKILSTGKRSGAAVARNLAIAAANGRYIAFLDSDDLWLPEKLEKQIEFMKKTQCAFSFSQYAVIDEAGRKTAEFKPKKSEYGYKDLLKNNAVGCLTAMYDAKKLGKVFMPKDAFFREDLACWLEIIKKGHPARCQKEILSEYRLRRGSVSSDKLKMLKYQWKLYRKIEKLNFFKSFFYLSCWAVSGLFKYKKIKLR